MERDRLIALIHIAKSSARVCPGCSKVIYRKECPDCGIPTQKMDNQRYRKVLESFGASSCRFMEDQDLEKVYRFFIQAGFVPRTDPGKAYAYGLGRSRAVAISEARKLFGDEMWEKRLTGFIRKTIGKQNLWECDDKELRKAIGWIRRYRKYLRKREGERQ